MSLNLEVQILGEYKNLTKATRGATNQLKGLQSSAKRISSSINATLATIGVGLTFGGLASGIKSVVTEASNLEQGIGASKAVFKGFADDVVANSKRAANAFGLSSVQYLQSANLIGAQLSNLGFTQKEYTDQSQDLVALGADLAATFGGTTYDAVLALSAVFRGEYNQVEKYGVAIRKSDITARVAQKGFKDLTGEALKQQEALAALEILYGQTAAAQGQFARETDTFAGSMQILRANLDNAKVALGDGFSPALVAIADWITSNIDTFNDLTEAIGTRLKAAFEGTSDSAETFGAAIINTITDLTAFLNGSQDTSNVFVKASENIKPFLDLLGALGEVFKGIITVLDGVFDGLFGWINLFRPAGDQVNGLTGFLNFLGKGLQQIGYWFGVIASAFIPFTTGFKVAAGVLAQFSRAANSVFGFLGKLGPKIKNFFGGAAKQVDELADAQAKVANGGINVAKGTQGSVKEYLNLSKTYNKLNSQVPALTKYVGNAAKKFDDNRESLRLFNRYAGYARTEIGAVTEAVKRANENSEINIDIKVRFTESAGELNRFKNLRTIPNPYANGAEPDYLRVIREQTAKAAETGIDEGLGGTGALTPFQEKISKIVDTLKSSLDDAKKRIKSTSESFRDSVSLAFGVITNGAFAVFDINRVLRQMRRLVDGAKDFAKNIKQLQKEGADQSLIDQLLGMDPLSGAATARGLLSSGRLQEFLDLRGQLSGIGAGAGGVANFGIYGTGTGGLSNAIESLTKTLERGYGNTYTINVNNANKMSGQEIVAAIKRYEKTTGRAVL